MIPPSTIRHSKVRVAAGVIVVAAVYIYFLIFAQFAFLRMLREDGLDGGALRAAMGFMGVAGVVSSLGAGWFVRRDNAQRLLLAGFSGSFLAAALALTLHGMTMRCMEAALIGVSLGLLTVSFAVQLPYYFPRNRRGFLAGIGTGLAYAVCNIPLIFGGSTLVQSCLALGVCVAGAVIVLSDSTFGDRYKTGGEVELLSEPQTIYSIGASAFGPLVVVFLGLVWLDSAAFYILQATPTLNQFGWGDAALQRSNAGIHFVAACIGGLLLDRGWIRQTLVAAFAALALAAFCLSSHLPVAHLANWLYAGGVSLYSTALVLTPALAKRPLEYGRRAGILYAVAGWIGSALGIGMAQDLHAIPAWFIWVSGAVIITHIGLRPGFTWRDYFRRAAVVAAVGFLAFTVAKTTDSRARLNRVNAGSIALGREVYIAEGCLNCHSQYVRPGTSDELWWGPAISVKRVLNQAPPLIGNRRQGPDLQNIGNRRSREWNRLHLMNPRALLPRSRMPSYAYLFAPGDSRGEALLDYLASLGDGTEQARIQIRQSWHPANPVGFLDKAAQSTLFRENCAMCHGETGAGNGPLAREVGVTPPRNLTLGKWVFIPPQLSAEQRTIELARTIKFGVPGTSMPGHEVFSDAKVMSLAKYVEALSRDHATSKAGDSTAGRHENIDR